MMRFRTVVFCLGAALLASCSLSQPQKKQEDDVPRPEDMNKPRMGFEDAAMPGMNPLLMLPEFADHKAVPLRRKDVEGLVVQFHLNVTILALCEQLRDCWCSVDSRTNVYLCS